MSRTIDLELTRAEVEVRELEARLRVVPMNDNQLSDALRIALAAKKDRLDKLRQQHAAIGVEAGKLISRARHVLISRIDRVGNQERAYLFYDVLHNDTMAISGAKSYTALGK